MKISFIKTITNSSQKSVAKSSSNKAKSEAKTTQKAAFRAEIISSEILKKSKEPHLNLAKNDFDFEAKPQQSCIVANENSLCFLIGAGEEKKCDVNVIQKLGAKCFSSASSTKSEVLQASISFNDSAEMAANLAFGALLQSYRFNRYFEKKLKEKQSKTKQIEVICADPKAAEQKFKELELLAKNIFFVRDLVSEPSNILNPESYSEICKSLKKEGLEVEILDESAMKKLGMNALLGVGQGSEKESKLVVLKWNGGKKSEAPLAFVGKGVTFDTGGISIKPANNMEDMKTDMAGSAVVVGLMKHLANRKAKVNAVGVVGLVENMPSGTAQRPGDVVKSMSGQTIEVINTDAEGRLVLADALHYCITKFSPKFVVDLATLTGAIIVALADVHAGLFSNDDELAKKLEECAKKTGEKLWRLPLGEEYDEMINSDIADMKNVGSGRGAGSTTAAQFLQRFVGETKWAHLDIAGVAWKGKGDALAHKGATGFGLRLLDKFVSSFE